MNRLKRKLAVNGVATILSVIIILAMVAAPVIASVTANSVDGSSIVDRSIQTIDLALGSVKTGILGKNAVTSNKIKDREVKTADLAVGAVGTGRIKNGAVTGAKIRDYTVAKEDLKSSSVNSVKIANGTITNIDIAAGAAIAASKINTAGLNADSVDGKHASDFAAYTHNHDLAYYTQAAANAAFAALGHDHDSAYVNDNAGEVDNADIANGAISDSKISYDTTKTRYLSIPPTAFRPTHNTNSFAIKNQTSATGTVYLYATGGWDTFQAPVQLPDGATITEVTLHALDNTSTTDIGMDFFRRPHTSLQEQLAHANTSGDSAAWQAPSDVSITSPVVDNANYSYWLSSNLYGPAGDLSGIGGATIKYQVTGP